MAEPAGIRSRIALTHNGTFKYLSRTQCGSQKFNYQAEWFLLRETDASINLGAGGPE